MSKEEAPVAAHEEGPGAAPAKKAGLSSKLKIAALVLAIVVVEGIAAYLFIPSNADVAAMAGASIAVVEEPVEKKSDPGHGGHGHADHAKPAHDKPAHEKPAKAHAAHAHVGHALDDEHTEEHDPHSLSEVDLGEFHITSVQPQTNTNLRIDFKLFGMIPEEEHHEFEEHLEKNRHRIRDQVISIARSAEMTDLTDGGLGLIKRRILETTNRTLGKAYLKAVVFSDFSVVEQ